MGGQFPETGMAGAGALHTCGGNNRPAPAVPVPMATMNSVLSSGGCERALAELVRQSTDCGHTPERDNEQRLLVLPDKIAREIQIMRECMTEGSGFNLPRARRIAAKVSAMFMAVGNRVDHEIVVLGIAVPDETKSPKPSGTAAPERPDSPASGARGGGGSPPAVAPTSRDLFDEGGEA